ncbi:SCP-like extracellular [Desulfotomaculum nigrificans CO-1-SRB]|uniref:SCP-like extracellular n=1 Tax=Desulfotomaculum nigrificans (strain DSM 14880 / VKM B-2319 / CO-1-SRB) TaxID=868595 RepID=F6B840_DESCC|nr:CAP domain-containing protein [Desulfotomaculum nigrificans]AEF93485.1 SCP-like extracellular [Desulfotomaculum nigrificans CO-1-SRB]
MRILAKLFGGLVVSAFALMLALTLPGTGSAEAYTSYNYTGYRNYTSYQPSTTYNYYRYNYNPTSYSNYTNYTKYNNYSNYTNYQKPNYSTPSQPTSTPSQPSTQTIGNVNTADEQAMLNLINKERVANGLQPLTADAKLTEVARLKAKDMIANNYFGHT